MPATKATDDQIIEAHERLQSPTRAAAELGITVRVFHSRLASIEARLGERLRLGKGSRVVISRSTSPNNIEIADGCIVVGSDAHYWPDHIPTAHRAMVRVIERLKPEIVVMNGDEFDGAQISRHARIGWERAPSVRDEIKALSERMGEISKAAGRAKKLGSFGNHTVRFDTYLSGGAPQMEGVPGMRFEDILPEWNYAWAWMVNQDVLIKHRIAGGVHASWNNTMKAGISTVTGHTHQLEVKPRTFINRTVYGVDTGMMADPFGPQFGYVECGPRNWRSGFAVLTFKGGKLMPPELCHIIDEGEAWFRGEGFEV